MIPSPAEVDKIFDHGKIVKTGSIREVRRCDDIFLKLDRRLNRSFKKEFNCAATLAANDIPVVKPLFFIRSGRGNYLATKACDGVSVEAFLNENTPDKDFYFRAADLLLKMLDTGFIHWDFHLGNLLYVQNEQKLVLVDVDSIKKLPKWLTRFIPVHIKFHLLAEFRRKLAKAELMELFEYVKVPDPENFYRDIFIRDAKYILHTWPRRRKQILSGYQKFTTCFDGELFDSSADENDFADTESRKSGRAIFLAHFFLDLIQIPHRRALRFSPASGEVILAAANPIPAPENAALEMAERLRFYGIETNAEDWRANANGLPELHNLDKVAVRPFIM